MSTVWILLGLLILTSTSDANNSPTAPHAEFVDALWVAEADRVRKLALADGVVLFEVPNPGGFDALAVDEQAGILWAYGHTTLYAYNFAGELLWASPVVSEPRRPHAHHHGWHDRDHGWHDRDWDGDDDDARSRTALIANANDGSVWLARQKTLVHVDAQGQVLAHLRLSHQIEAVSLDTSRNRLWVATQKGLTAYDAFGAQVTRIAPDGAEQFRALVYAPAEDILWVAVTKEPWYRFGAGTWRRPLHGTWWPGAQDTLRRYAAGTGLVESEVPLAETVDTLALDHHGGLWAAAGTSLLKLDAAGKELWRRKPFQGKEHKHIVALVDDPVAHAVWVASRDTVRQVSATGAVHPPLSLRTGKKHPKVQALALYADLLPPMLTIVHPQGDSLINTHYPSMVLHYRDSGMGVDTSTLALLVHDQPVAVRCDMQQDSATCTPTSPLPEGQNLLHATVRDLNGNLSSAVELALVIDTLPPAPVEVGSITVSDPVDGQVILTGAPGAAEPGAVITVTNRRTGVSVTVQAGADGGFVAELAAEAGDSFTVVAADAAGNPSPAVTLEGIVLHLTITTPVAGATVQADWVQVTGTLQAPQPAGVVVNGVIALVDGEQFVANQVPLQEGTNTLTAVATDSAGHATSTTITIERAASEQALRLTLTAETYMGLAPLETTLRIEGALDYAPPSLTVTGPGNVELVAGASATEYTARLTAAGLYTFTAKARDSAWNFYTDTITIQVLDRTALDTRLRALWDGMKQALARQDISQAVRYFTDESTELYQEIFTVLSAELPQIVQEMQEIQLIDMENTLATYRIRREELHQGQQYTITYYIYFAADSHGLWKILRF